MMRAPCDGNPEHIDIIASRDRHAFPHRLPQRNAWCPYHYRYATYAATPIRILTDALRQLGAHIEYVGNEGFPPLRITGSELQGCEISLAGNVSSQYISALLMIGTVLPKGLHLHLTGDIISRPYINLTLQAHTGLRRTCRLGLRRLHHRKPGGYRIPLSP